MPIRAERIDRQLSRLTRGFLADPSKGMRHDGDGTLWLSSIFKWYAGDFTGGSTVVAFFSRGGVAEWVRGQLPAEVAAEIGDSSKVRYLDYDWALNDRPVASRTSVNVVSAANCSGSSAASHMARLALLPNTTRLNTLPWLCLDTPVSLTFANICCMWLRVSACQASGFCDSIVALTAHALEGDAEKKRPVTKPE